MDLEGEILECDNLDGLGDLSQGELDVEVELIVAESNLGLQSVGWPAQPNPDNSELVR